MILIAALILLGLVLTVVEILLIPGFGIAGIGGILSLGGAVGYAFAELGGTAGYMTLAAVIVLEASAIILVFRSGTWKRLKLEKNITSRVDTTPQEKGLHAGDTGTATSRLAPTGKASFERTETEVISRDGLIDAGSRIKIAYIEGNRIFVEKETSNKQ